MSSLARCRQEFDEIAAQASAPRPLTATQADRMGTRLAGMVLAGRAAQGTVMSWLGTAVAAHRLDDAEPLENWRRVAEALRRRLSSSEPAAGPARPAGRVRPVR